MNLASLLRPSIVAYTISLVVTAAAHAQAAPQASPQGKGISGSTLAQSAPAAEATPPSEPATPASAPETAPSAASVASAAPAPPAAQAGPSPSYFQFTEIEYLHGFYYREPGNSDHQLQKEIITFQHYGEWAYGRNFFFFDFVKSHSSDGDANEIYGEAYSTLSASKVFNTSLDASIFHDIGLTMGINVGAKTNSSGPLIYLPGITTDWKIPGFTYFNVDTLAYIDHGRFGGSLDAQQCNGVSFQITPAWDIPFTIGPARFDFQGFVDFIGGHGVCSFQILAQPQLRLDVGNFFGAPDKLYVGTEYQYWLHKYGFEDVTEYHPQTLVLWRF